MKTRIRLEEPAFGEAFEKEKINSVEVPNGNMMPTMREVRDTVTIEKPQNQLKKNDVIVYKGADGEFTLSRIVYINNGTYSVSGDGQKTTEYNIADSQIVGVMTSFERKDKMITADNKYYSYYVKVLPVVKAVYSLYFLLKVKTKNFIDFLFKK